jgi:hypothetical protein
MTDGTSRFAISLDELERTAHVPLEEQVESHPEPVASEPIDPDWQEQQRILRFAGG